MRRLAEHLFNSSDAKKVKVAGVRCRAVNSEGPTVEHIVREAQDQRVDLIVIGTRGSGAIERTLLGSVSPYVVAHAPCPVTMVRW